MWMENAGSHGEEGQCPSSPNSPALAGWACPSSQKVARPLYPVWGERVNDYFPEQNVRPGGEVLLSGINQYMEFTLVTSERAGSQHSSPQHWPERGQQRLSRPEFPMTLSPAASAPSLLFPLKHFWLHPHPSHHFSLSTLPMTQASPAVVPVSHFWAGSQHMLRISKMCSWLSCCWFGPHCFSLIKPQTCTPLSKLSEITS